MNDIAKKIVSNLENRVHPVNALTAIAGTDTLEGFRVLRKLEETGRVQAIEDRDRKFPPMYRLVPTYRIHKIVK